MKAVIYIRVSGQDQNPERQAIELPELASRDGYKFTKTFEDIISGATIAESRKGFSDMLTYMEENNITQIYCWEISRIGRSLKDTVNIIDDFTKRGINICTKKEGLNTLNRNSSDELQLNMLMSLAQYERSVIRERTVSGIYNSVRKGGVGTGSVVQYGYYKDKNKRLIIDKEEAAVVRNICDMYLNKSMNTLQIANYLNDKGIKTRYKKLVESGTIKYKIPSDLLWTDHNVSNLLHKRILTGYRKYGTFEQQFEEFRIISDEMFNAIQTKMVIKRKTKANAQVYENILKGTLICGNCGATVVMQKSSSGLQNHYQCYNRFRKKDKSCTSAMINIDLLNNTIYETTKNFVVASTDIESKITELHSQIEINNTAISQLNKEQQSLSTEEERLVDLYLKGRIKINIYEKKLQELTKSSDQIKLNQRDYEASTISLQSQVTTLENKKTVDLKEPAIFKANVRELLESISVINITDTSILNDIELKELSYFPDFNKRSTRHKYFLVRVKMFDSITGYSTLIHSRMKYDKVITVGKINPQDKNKDLFRTKQSKPIDTSITFQ